MAAARKVSAEDRVRVRDAYLTLETVHSIAKRFRIHTKTVAIIAASLGAPSRRSLSKRQRIIRLFGEGRAIADIARELKTRRAYVNHVLTECGFKASNVASAKHRGDICAAQEVRP